jgi:predicted alpha/beta superfamily hydrolase
MYFHGRARLLVLVLFAGVTLLACSSSDDGGGTTYGQDSGSPAVDSGADGADTSTPKDSGTAGDTGTASDTSTTGDAPSDGTGETASHKTRFVVHYPAGSHTISMRGSAGGFNWTKGLAMTAGASDTWTLETDAIVATTEWKPLLDDTTWSRGPNYTVEPGQTVDVYPHFTTTAGKYEVRWPKFHSTILGNDRGIWVYYPPSYLENATTRMPVVYMHDGQNLFDPSTAFGGNEWKVDETMNAGAEDGSIREAIVIGVENTAARMDEYTPTRDATEGFGGKGDDYIRMLITELKPVVDGALRTQTGRESTAMMGSSLGGLISSYAGTTSSSTFGLIGALSPSTWWDGTMLIGTVAATKGKSPEPLRVYVDSGDSGTSNDDMTNTAKLAQTYRDVGYVDDSTLKYVLQKGASHSEIYWAQRLPGALHFLLGARQ